MATSLGPLTDPRGDTRHLESWRQQESGHGDQVLALLWLEDLKITLV